PCIAAFSLLALVSLVSANAATEKIIYSFKGDSDGAEPYASVIADKSGALYGTTRSGGASGGFGTAFKLSPPAAGSNLWKETVLHRFTGGKDGAFPEAPLVMDATGNLYGTTSGGGTMTSGCLSS